jgi:hypothetical protein
VALESQSVGYQQALWSHEGGFVVALESQLIAYQLPISWLCGGFGRLCPGA